ncbi:alanine--tRNA ligase [Ferrimonas sediminicola]|uniref:Alanine--tRNA ligase n=1 Tax=Ferrimonas sediminicola TaxID=2569538 RepID=A0A4U1BDM4_9GAMM|nr:alanine--tRNA ligase [Ferrimonas sediminicola]TKB49203.1 alanine--tRNA ligase [Ferrimonas sediminicola]
MRMTTAEIREAFLEYFRTQNHEVVESSSLVPHNDPTLLFTNAGMNQFKDVFLGAEQRNYSRATTSQRCVRAGGKHNDLENVGYTARHHTFFEMLGNFSFGDYFKRDAIKFAWTFLTEELKLPKEKLCVTIYDSDDEAYEIWLNEVGVPADAIIRIGDNKGAPYASDNFWQMGDTGPCGPCTEIFYDHGEHIWGGRPGTPEEDGDRFIEIWNIVFMQYNRQADGTMEPLPKPSVDTGMGLERIAAIMQGVHSNYEIDLFQALIKQAGLLLAVDDLENNSLKVIADHIRSCAFLIADGVMPSNEGRGYVLRRIIRRAVRHGHKLGARQPFFHRLAPKLAELMGAAYDELNTQMPVISKVLKTEEEQFLRTVDRGLALLEEVLENLEGDTIPGAKVFELYDTYGFPADLTGDIARERDVKIDQEGFDAAMAEQRKRAQQASKFGMDYNEVLRIDSDTEFSGYTLSEQAAKVVAIYREGDSVQQLQEGEEGQVILDTTPFYAESGGQVGDTGELLMSDGAFTVTDTRKAGNAVVHIGYVSGGEIHVGEELTAAIDSHRRQAIKLNHTATHLLHAALRKVLGEHVTQKGSLVNAQGLRFDFSHFEGVDIKTLRTVEKMVNDQIRANSEVATRLMNIDEAKTAGAMALFGEKYDDEVRVVNMGEFSTELCGGTHVERTGDIGFFKIVSEGGIAAGVRRIEAITGQVAIDAMHQLGEQLEGLATMVKSDTTNLAERVRTLVERSRWLEKEVDRLNAKLTAQAGASLADNATDINGTKVIVANLEGAEPKSLRDTLDQLKNKLGSGIVVLATAKDDKVSLIAGVTKDLTAKVKSGELVNMVAQQVGGKGGGRPDMAQAGGTDVAALPAALASVNDWLAQRL